MFGYVTVCKNALSEQGLKTFKAYYCGLCKAIGKRCSQSARLGLSYDITFLAIVLSSVCKNEISMKDKKCVLHPIRENIRRFPASGEARKRASPSPRTGNV